MSTSPTAPRTSKVLYWTGWVISVLPVLALSMSATMKFLKPPEVVKGFETLGFPESTALPLGIVEIVAAVLYLIPQTSVLGAILVTGYLGGATAAHVRLNEPQFVAPVIIGMVAWLGLFLRDGRIRALIPFKTSGPY